MSQEDTVEQKINRFHEHLDCCEQCRNHPFALCFVGARLLHNAGTYVEEAVARLKEKGDTDASDVQRD